VLQVVERVTATNVLHASEAIELVEHHWHQRRLPVVGVEDVGPLAGLEEELERRLGEEGEPHVLVREAVVRAPLEEVIVGVRLNEEALAAVHEAKPDGAPDAVVEPRDPEVLVAHLQAPDVVVPHAVVLREDDLHRVPADLQLAAQAEDHVAEAPDLGDRRALGGDHDDVHG